MLGRQAWAVLAATATLLGAPGAGAQGAGAAPDAPAAGSPPPKVVVVVAGDPDADLRAHATDAHQAVEAHSRLRAVEDAGLAAALRGEPSAEPDDGLERARAERRKLGWGEARDVPVLGRIGHMTGADLLLVARHGADGAELVAYDVEAGAFYEGHLALPAPNKLERFILARAEAASKGPSAAPSPETAAAGAEPPPDAPSTSAAPEGAAQAEDKGAQAEPDDGKSWIGRNWPYFVAGALLAGTVVLFSVRRARDDPPQPVLRFRIGGDP